MTTSIKLDAARITVDVDVHMPTGTQHSAMPQCSILGGQAGGGQLQLRTSTPVVPATPTCTTYNACTDGIQPCALSAFKHCIKMTAVHECLWQGQSTRQYYLRYYDIKIL